MNERQGMVIWKLEPGGASRSAARGSAVLMGWTLPVAGLVLAAMAGGKVRVEKGG